MDSKGSSIIPSKNISAKAIDFRHYLSPSELSAIEYEVSIMETQEAASIEALKVVQQHRGWVSDDSLKAIAQCLNISTVQLEGVATFYNLIYRQKVGRNVVHICDSIACHLTGFEEVLLAIKVYLGIDYGQTTENGEFTLLSNACLGSCDKAPAMMVNQQHYHSLTALSAVAILSDLSDPRKSTQEKQYD